MDNRVHALSHEMQPKSTRTEFARGKALEGIGLGFCTMVEQDNFQAILLAIFWTNLIEPNFDRAVQFAAISVPDNIGNRLIDCERDGAAIFFAKTHDFCNGRNRPPNAAKNSGITQ